MSINYRAGNTDIDQLNIEFVLSVNHNPKSGMNEVKAKLRFMGEIDISEKSYEDFELTYEKVEELNFNEMKGIAYSKIFTEIEKQLDRATIHKSIRYL